jgi:hypothetical protein
MALSKAAIAEESQQYAKKLEAASMAAESFDYAAALASAVDSLVHLDALLQFKRKEGAGGDDEFHASQFILQLSPPLFSHESLDHLADVIVSRKRMKDHFAGVSARIAVARRHIDECREFWNGLFAVGYSAEEIDAASNRSPGIAAAVVVWENMGLVYGSSNDQGAVVTKGWREQRQSAKCSNCGTTARAKRAGFIHPLECPRCHNFCDFVVVGPVERTGRT